MIISSNHCIKEIFNQFSGPFIYLQSFSYLRFLIVSLKGKKMYFGSTRPLFTFKARCYCLKTKICIENLVLRYIERQRYVDT